MGAQGGGSSTGGLGGGEGKQSRWKEQAPGDEWAGCSPEKTVRDRKPRGGIRRLGARIEAVGSKQKFEEGPQNNHISQHIVHST